MQIPALPNVTAPGVVLPPNPNAGAGSAASPSSFSDLLMQQVSHLNDLQLTAQDQSQALATGQASDVSAVVTAVEQASLAMQLAVQVRNKATDAYQEIMRMQI
jgi:flagellar hook-basal body complex protein FliE